METPLLDFLEGLKEFEVVAMAKCARRAVEIIVPWCQADHSCDAHIVKDVQKQLRTYARAIDFSVDAATTGYAVAEDALFLIESIHTASPEDRKDFLHGILSATERGLAQAKEAQHRFLSVRTTVMKLVENMKAEDHEARKIRFSKLSVGGIIDVIWRSFGDIRSELIQGINDLEEFSKILDKFAKWWTEMVMETKAQLQRGQIVADNSLDKLDKIRVLEIQRKWEDHKAKYCGYVNQIQAVQDQYPNVFKLQDAAKNFEKTDFDSEESRVTMSMGSEMSDIFPRCESPPPEYQPRRQAAMLISHCDLATNSYVSASLGMVQILPGDLCFLEIDIQCHPSPRRRVDYLDINCHFLKGNVTVDHTSHGPMVYDVAPKQSIGARNEEMHNKKIGVSMPIKAPAVIPVGPELNAEYQIARVVEHATVITGSIRGKDQDHAKWTIEENPSARTGVPPHFCVAIVVHYSGLFCLDLEIHAKQRGRFRRSLHPLHARVSKTLDIERLVPQYEPQTNQPSDSWRDWFPLITGDIKGGNVLHAQVPLRRHN